MSTDQYQVQIVDENIKVRYTETENGIELPKDDSNLDILMKGTMFRQLDRMYMAGEFETEEEYKKEFKKIANAIIIHEFSDDKKENSCVIHSKPK